MDLLSHGFTGPAFTAIGQEFYPTLELEGQSGFTPLTGALGVAWEHGGPDGSRSLFQRAGFTCVATSATFYADVYAESGQSCVACAGTPCRCGAMLFVRWGLPERPVPGEGGGSAE